MVMRPNPRALSREHALWLSVALSAGALRLLGLSLPLGDAEASAALSFLAASRGESALLLNPLAGFLQSLTLLVFGAGDAAPRLAPALAGSAMCLLPYLVRAELGRSRALSLAVLLALSPTLVFVSRLANGEMLAWTLAAALVVRTRGRGRSAAVLTGLLMACGAHAIAPMVTVLLVSVLDCGAAVFKGVTRRQIATAALAFAAGASGLFIRPAGIADAFDGYAAWFQGFAAAPTFSAGRLFGGLVINELFVLAFALIALASVVVNRARVAGVSPALGWLTVGILGTAVYAARSPDLLVPVVCGAALMASMPLGQLTERMASRSREPSGWMDWAVAGVGFVLLQFVGIGMRQYAAQTQSSFLVPIVVAVILCGGLIGAAALNGMLGVGVRGIGVALTATLALYVTGTAWQLTQVRWDSAAEPYVSAAPSQELRALVDTVRESGIRATGEPDGLSLNVDPSAPASLRWVLRDQRKMSAGNSAADMTLLPAAAKPDSARGYIGNQFEVTRSGNLSPVRCNSTEAATDCSALARWALFREINPGDVTSQRWTLWLSNDIAAKISGQR